MVNHFSSRAIRIIFSNYDIKMSSKVITLIIIITVDENMKLVVFIFV
jgi:hypothetical protein